jgi:tetratricopeptide (TPR) repeat protein
MFIRLRRFEDAAKCLESLLKAVPLDGQAHAALGLCLIHLGEPERAERHLSRAVSLRPADLGLRAARASLLFSRQILDKAIEDAEVIARLRPGNPGYRQLIEAIRTAI